MAPYQTFLSDQKNKLLKAIAHLEYSYTKILSLPLHPSDLDEESLETWESFTARFGRVADIFLMKYIKAVILQDDPGFGGSLRDFVNQAEKLDLIENANQWMAIRELRNITAHEYSEKDLEAFFKRLKEEAPLLIALKKKLV